MCENCDKQREELWSEIRDLLNYNRKVKGPISQDLSETVEKMRESGEYPEEDIFAMCEELRAEMITVRCAFIVHHLPGSEYHGVSPSIVMGLWAGNSLKIESAVEANLLLTRLMKWASHEESDDSDG